MKEQETIYCPNCHHILQLSGLETEELVKSDPTRDGVRIISQYSTYKEYRYFKCGKCGTEVKIPFYWNNIEYF